MADLSNLYPPGPEHVPLDFTKPSRDYRWRVLVVLGSLVLFVALYVGLVAGTAYLTYYSFTSTKEIHGAAAEKARVRGYQAHRRERDASGWWVILGICSGALCLFLVKGLFKWQKSDPSLRVEIRPDEQPRLFEFIHQVCRDTNAPKPHRVYLTPEVNAAVFYHSSLLSLVFPTPKNLLIGLGLVNRLNLTEFKAVLAHEFGHFSQNSMKLGAYVYTSNRIVADVVYGRDWLDQAVGFLRRTDVRIAIIAWAFTGMLWGVRQVLEKLFQTINFANSALMRQMEFNADLVAVSVSGSDALVNGLARLDFAQTSLMQACGELSVAADHHLFTNDLFLHHARAADRLRVTEKNPRLGEPPELLEQDGKPVQVFEPGDLGVPLMWATHPTNHDREKNAKRHYLRCRVDDRSPWLLFDDLATVRANVTRRFYEVSLAKKNPPLADAATVQAFIDEEYAEVTYDPRHHGMFDERFLNPGDLDALMQAAPEELPAIQLLAADFSKTCADELKTRMESFQKRQIEHSILAGLNNGSLEMTGDKFTFRDTDYHKGDFENLFKQINAELEGDMQWLAALDRQAFLARYAMARHVHPGRATELVSRYRFHLMLQEMFTKMAGAQQHFHNVLGQVQGEEELSQEVYQWVKDELKKVRAALSDAITQAKEMPLPSLKNITQGTPLGGYLLRTELVAELGKRKLNPEWINQLARQLQEVLNRTQRIYAKSLGGILACHDQIDHLWASSSGSSMNAISDAGADTGCNEAQPAAS